VKYTNRLAFEQGTAFSRKALRGGAGYAPHFTPNLLFIDESSNRHSDEYFKLAEASFKAALQIKPDDIRGISQPFNEHLNIF